MLLRSRFHHTIAGLLAFALATSLFARGQFWDFLGSTQVDSSQDHGRIQITRRDVHFRTIQLRVSGDAIFFDHLVVHFDDGTSQKLMVSDRILPGGRNYVTDLLGERSLESVELWYYKEPRRYNPRVSLYGVRSPEGKGQNIAQEHERSWASHAVDRAQSSLGPAVPSTKMQQSIPKVSQILR
jgi:hypothetical protein